MLARLAAIVFLFSVTVSLTAEFWANNKPIVMSYGGQLYLPAWIDYHPSLFQQEDFLVTDYRNLSLGVDDWALWPLIPWSPLESNTELDFYPSPPSEVNILGTDDRGRDVLARLIYGLRYSLGYAFGVWFFSYLIGTVLGALMGYFGGWTDLLGQRVVEVFESIPLLPLLLVLITWVGSSLPLLIVFSVLTGWMMISLYMRAEFLKHRRREYVLAAQAVGLPWHQVLYRHILPNALTPLITLSPFALSGAIASLAVLDFLGFGLPAPTPSWGELLNQGQRYFQVAWWLALFPGLSLFLTLATLNLLGEGLRKSFSPKE